MLTLRNMLLTIRFLGTEPQKKFFGACGSNGVSVNTLKVEKDKVDCRINRADLTVGPSITNLLKNMKIKPLSDYIVIEPITQEEKTETGIFLPQTAEKEKPEQGKVIAVGPGKVLSSGKRLPLEVKKGDIVIFTKYSPNEVKVGEKEYLIAKEEDILAILE